MMAPSGSSTDDPAAPLRALLTVDPRRIGALPVKTQWEIYACLRGLCDLSTAALVLDALAELHGPLAKVLDAQADLWPRLGRYDEALRAARERVERFPSPTGELMLARAYLATERLEDAAALAETIRARDPARPEGWLLLGQIALELGDAETAVEVFEQARSLRPDSVVVWRELARARAALGDTETAAALLTDCFDSLSPSAPIGALTALAELAEELSEDARAAGLRQRAAVRVAERAAMLAPQVAGTPVTRDRDRAAAPLADLRAGAADEVPAAPEVLAAAREYFGYARLRTGQARVIEQVLAGVDTLVTMPTGAGKSLCYQLSAMLLPGVTVVISPLIALMQDQVESLPPALAARATLVNSTLDPAELRRRQDALAAGAYKLVYAAPERLRQASFLRALAAAGVSLLVIDEAHCISLWGHDFRPDYLVVPRVLPVLGEPCVLAMTATATPEIAREIEQRLGRSLARVQVSLFRPNLFYEVRRVQNKEAKLRAVVEVCGARAGSGIVYVTSREGCEQIATLLNRELKRRRYEPDVALAYHAGFEQADRAERMRRFMAGEVRIMVATVAFGMGVDKADVRFIVHLSPPKSLEAYAQESGRAGRDGLPSRCVLLYAPSDKASLNRWARLDEVDIETLRRGYARLRRVLGKQWGVVSFADVLPPMPDDSGGQDARVALGILERAGLVERHPDAPRTADVHWRGGVPDGDEHWPRFLAATGLRPGERQSVDLVAVARQFGCSPAELEAWLVGWRTRGVGIQVNFGRRDLCLRLVDPPPPNTVAELPRLLDEVRRESERRVARMVVFATSRSCRHAALAAHLGERLPACGTMCDSCTSANTPRAASEKATAGNAPGSERLSPPAKPTPALDAVAALTVLQCLKLMPFPIGRSGLTKVLAGSIAAAAKGDRVPQFGALEGLPHGKINGFIDQLVEDDFIHRDETSEYRRLVLTPAGRAATLADLTRYNAPPSARQRARTAGLVPSASLLNDGTFTDAADWTPEQYALLARLKAWRTEQAHARAVPAYVIAHDRMLHELVTCRPVTRDELLAVKGFGPAKVDTYGAELLALLNEVGA